MQDVGVARGLTAAGGPIVETKLLLAMAGVVATLILAQPCDGTAPGNSPLDSQGEGRWRGSCLGLGDLWLPRTLSPLPLSSFPPGRGDLRPSELHCRGQIAGGCRLQSDSEEVGRALGCVGLGGSMREDGLQPRTSPPSPCPWAP